MTIRRQFDPAARGKNFGQEGEYRALVEEVAALREEINKRKAEKGEYSPEVSTGTGTFTTAYGKGWFQRIHNGYFVHVEIVITTNGTGATDVRFTLPAIPIQNLVGYGRSAVAGLQLQVRSAFGNARLGIITNYDGTYPGASGETLSVDLFLFVG